MSCIRQSDLTASPNPIQNDFDVRKWAAPEFLEEPVKQLVQERWEKLSTPAARLG